MNWITHANWLLCVANLAIYSLAEPKPLNLAVGIFCGLVALKGEIVATSTTAKR